MIWQSMKDRADAQLTTLFEHLTMPSERLKSAMQYAVLSSGKRLRPILIYLTGRAFNVAPEILDNAICAVECMHAYSLVHDDLPAMDNDDWRRGKPTCHRAFDEATAILAGDALQALAFQQMLQTNTQNLTAAQKNEMAITLSIACGAQGMVSGQAMDLEYLTQMPLSETQLKCIHQLKTGILIETCIQLAILAVPEQNNRLINNLKKDIRSFSQYLGLAFQIQDDYLDVYGQQQGADARQEKTTYATMYTQKDLADLIHATYQQALSFLMPYRESISNINDLIAFTEYLAKREL